MRAASADATVQTKHHVTVLKKRTATAPRERMPPARPLVRQRPRHRINKRSDPAIENW